MKRQRKLKKVFGQDASETEKDLQKGFTTGFKRTFTQMAGGKPVQLDKEIDDLFKACMEKIRSDVTYQVKVKKRG
ncbi:DUF5105 domain-containing protein [Listeria floridensis]|uniref:DUF5105 domain-containing protein n=1 Tax=Listeria floridensis TaxID=1494962 RepID=UPI0011E9F2CE